MELVRAFYLFARIYVWSLLVLGLFTIGLILAPDTVTVTLAGMWFALGGFGSIVLIMGVLVYLLR